MICRSFFLVVILSPLAVQIPAPFSFLTSAALMPCCCSPSKSTKKSSASRSAEVVSPEAEATADMMVLKDFLPCHKIR